MGMCNVIPGGDSGTVALVVGIYHRIVTAISQADGTFASLLLKGRWRNALQRVDAGFMLPLVAGVGCGIASMGSLMHYLLEHHFQVMMPIFFGLIGASCYLVARLIHRWRWPEVVLLIGGAGAALWLIRQPGLSHPPEQLWYIVLCGVIGICALILPGISGAFILVIMGK
jgi:putative membrane protein